MVSYLKILEWLSRMNLIEQIAIRHASETVAILAGERRVTYGELFAEARRVAAELRPYLPVGRVARVGLQCPNGLSYIVLSMGLLLADACLVPLAEELAMAERETVARTTALDLILATEDLPWPGEAIWSGVTEGICWSLHRGPEVEPEFPEDEFQKIGPAFIRFSSGTTGRSKGVVLSHRGLLERITAANEGLRLDAEDRVLWMLPMAHHFAVSIVLYFYVGATTVLEHSPLREDILATAERTGATVIYASPFHFAMLAGDRGDFRWPTLRLAVATAAALPEATARAFEARFAKPLTQGLGIIEVGLSVLNLKDASRCPTAIGRPLPAYTVRLLDEEGREVAEGESGEFHVSGPGLLDAYLVPWQPWSGEVREFSSGDLVMRDADGLLHLKGRSKSVINVAGMKVFPEEVEAVLATHPGVQRARVYGREHPQMGQTVCAEFIATQADAPPRAIELQKYCRAVLSAYKVPMWFQVVTQLPLTASGKIRRVTDLSDSNS